MSKTAILIFSLLSFCFLPISAHAQCSGQPCEDLQNILDAAVTDYRSYTADKAGGPELTISETKFQCQTMAWANNVPMYMCYAQLPYAKGQSSYEITLDALKRIKPAWQFRVNSPNDDHYVDAGPPDCEIPPNDGPYIGQCPLHVQTVKQPDGTIKFHFWMNSLTSAYLAKRPPAPKTAAPATASDCDEFCQNFKKAFMARMNSFEDIHTAKTNDGISEATVKLEGAKECVVKGAAASPPNVAGTQFVCYWTENSEAAAETRFHNLVTRAQTVIPPGWSTRQESELDESAGAKTAKWYAVEPGGKHDIRVNVSGVAVGLHITTWN